RDKRPLRARSARSNRRATGPRYPSAVIQASSVRRKGRQTVGGLAGGVKRLSLEAGRREAGPPRHPSPPVWEAEACGSRAPWAIVMLPVWAPGQEDVDDGRGQVRGVAIGRGGGPADRAGLGRLRLERRGPGPRARRLPSDRRSPRVGARRA